MRMLRRSSATVVVATVTAAAGAVAGGDDEALTAVPFSDVRLEGGFWGPRLETNRWVTVPYCLARCRETGRIDNFARAAGLMKGPHAGQRYDDSDIYKVIEGAAYALQGQRDEGLE